MRLFLSIFGGVAGLMIIATAIIAIFTIRAVQEAEARIERLSNVGAAAVVSGPIGREVVIEGRVSQRMRPSHGDLVAYYSVIPSEDSGDSAVDYGPEAFPPLLIETTDGTVEVRGGYRLNVEPRTLPGEEAVSYYGVGVGELIAVAGTVARTIEFPALDGELVFTPPASRYADLLRSEAREGWIGAGICGVLGVVFGGFTLLFRRVFADEIDTHAEPQRAQR